MRVNWLSKFLVGKDAFGHPVSVVYKGRETHGSILGGIFTLLMQGLTAVYMFAAFHELLMMEDP